MKADLYNMEGKKEGEISLPEEVFGLEVNEDLIYQVARAQMSNRRQNTAHTKDRSEVRGGGRKPWRQKGTGRARHGSRRSPIWKGGGVTFGPRNERNYKKKINKKAKRKALFMVLSAKTKENLALFLSDLKVKEPKTKEMKGFLEKMPCDKRTLIVLPEIDRNAILATRNMEDVGTIQAKDLNVLDILSYKWIILPKKSVETIKQSFNQ